MKVRVKQISFIFIFISLITFYSCNKNNSPNLASLETLDAIEITKSTAKMGGNITSDGGGAITARGICWDIVKNPSITNNATLDGTGTGNFVSTMTNLNAGTNYYYKAYATNVAGTSYGDEKSFKTLSNLSSGQIIADHTIVSDFDKIPQTYINLVKKMWVSVAGESHAAAVRTGATLLESSFPAYQVNVTESGTPEAYTDQHLRLSCATWGDYSNSTGWIYSYGEEDWFTNSTAINRTKAGITYCNTHNLPLSAIGFGWCYDMVYSEVSATTDPAYGCHWYGGTSYGTDGYKAWGLDAADFSITGNTVCMDTYLNATEEYISYCTSNGYSTKVFFTTGPVEDYYSDGEAGYQGSVKHLYIRDYVKKNSTRILFDYADILCYDDNGTPTTKTWNGHTFPYITTTNLTPGGTGHISYAGCVRLAKAMWWMLARMAGWDGN